MPNLTQWLVSAAAILVSAFILPGVTVGIFSALGAAIVLSLVNIYIKPVLIALTLPINVLTLGLFTLVINAILIMLVSAIVPGFKVNGFGYAVLFSIVLTIVTVIFGTWI